MKSRYINTDIDYKNSGLQTEGDQLGFIDPITATTALTAGAGIVQGVKGLFSSSSRDQKRTNRQQLMDALYGAGVSRSKFTNWHSDHWQAGVGLAELIQTHGQMAVDYLNEKAGATLNPSVSSSLIQGFGAYKRQVEARKAAESPAAVSTGATGPPIMKYTLIAGGVGLVSTALIMAIRSK